VVRIKFISLHLTITNAAIIMNALNMFITKGISGLDIYLRKLIDCGIIYNFPISENRTYIEFSRSADPYILYTNNLELAKKELKYLKEHLIEGEL